MTILPYDGAAVETLDGFRRGLYACMTRRADALFETAEAVLCAPGRVQDVARLSLAGECRRGHGGLYDGLACGRIDADRLRGLLAQAPLPGFPGGRIVLGVDVSNWPRPEAARSPGRCFCHTYARGKGQAQMIPGWPFSFVAALGAGPDSWTGVLDVERVPPGGDATLLTAAQLRGVVGRLGAAGHRAGQDPPVLVVADAGYDLTRLSWLLAGLPVTVCGRVRSDRVYRAAPEPAPPGPGRPRRHGARLALADPDAMPVPDWAAARDTARYGRVVVDAWLGTHQMLERRGGWARHEGELPAVEGTLIRLRPQRLPGDRAPKPMWLWAGAEGGPDDIDAWWMAYLRRFDLEHTFRLFKQQLGWTRPMLRSPDAAARWTWLVVAAHTQLRLARPLAADIRPPWQPRLPPERLTPARVRAGFPRIRATLTNPARPPKPPHPGPGRPPGSTNRARAPVQPVGKPRQQG